MMADHFKPPFLPSSHWHRLCHVASPGGVIWDKAPYCTCSAGTAVSPQILVQAFSSSILQTVTDKLADLFLWWSPVLWFSQQLRKMDEKCLQMLLCFPCPHSFLRFTQHRDTAADTRLALLQISAVVITSFFCYWPISSFQICCVQHHIVFENNFSFSCQLWIL